MSTGDAGSGKAGQVRAEQAPTAQAKVKVHERETLGIFRRLFRRVKSLVRAFRESVVRFSRDVAAAFRRGFRRASNTAAGQVVLSGLGMVYTSRLAINSARYLVYGMGAGLTFMLTQALALSFVVLGAAWFLEFGGKFLDALRSRPQPAVTNV